MTALFLRISTTAILLFANVWLVAGTFRATRADTARVSDLLRKGERLKKSKPDSAFRCFELIYDHPVLTPGDLILPLEPVDKAYVYSVIEALNHTGNRYYYDDQYNRAEVFFQRSLALARAAKLTEYTARALFDIGYIRYVNSRYREALLLFEEACQLFTEAGAQKGLFDATNASGLTLRRLGDLGRADSCYRECLNMASEMKDSILMADVSLNYGILLSEQGKLDEGIRKFEMALSIYEAAGNNESVSLSLLNIGVVLKMVSEYERALPYILRSAAIEEKKQRKSQLAIRYYNLADLYMEMGNREKAYEYCRKIQSVAGEIGSHPFEAECNFLLGKYFYLGQDDLQARRYFDLASGSAYKLEDKPFLANLSLWQARSFARLGETGKARSLALRSYQTAKELNLLIVLKESSALLSELSDRSGNAGEALKWYKAFMLHADSLSYFNQHKEIRRIEARFNFQEKEKENELLRDRAALQEQRLRNWTILTIALLAGVGLSLVIIILLVRNNLIVKRLSEHEKIVNLQHLEELEKELDGKNRELVSKMMFLNHKNEVISNLIKRLQEVREDPEHPHEEIVSIVNELRAEIPQGSWREFELQFIQVHPGFYQRLHEKHPDLTSYEQRLCAFLRMNLNTKEMAAITSRSPKSIEVTRSRIRSKLHLKRDDNLNSYLAAI